MSPLELLQLGANSFALIVAGWIYAAYIKNLRGTVESKNEQIKTIKMQSEYWEKRAADLEKQTPEYMEKVLSERISLREEEIRRLDEDRQAGSKLAKTKTREIARLREELEKATELSRALTYYDLDSDEDVVIPASDLELEYMGEIFVDSASILISDPMYVEQEWKRGEPYEDIRIYKDSATGRTYQFRKDFERYDEVIEELGGSVSDLQTAGRLQRLEIERDLTYSYPGAAYATLQKEGYGSLKFENGNEGAGICVRTVYGDGGYPVYGERYQGRIYRVYIDLQ